MKNSVLVETYLGSKVNYNKKEFEEFLAYCERVQELTEVTPEETRKEKEARIERLLNNYSQFVEYYFPHYVSAPCAPFHKKFNKSLISNKIVSVILEGFRGCAKSTHANIFSPIFMMFKGELHYMLLVGETEKKANRLISDIQAELQYNQRIVNDFGTQAVHGDWSTGEFQTKTGTYFSALGLGQNPRGIRKRQHRPDYIVVDDVDSKKRCKNPVLVREAVEWITDDLMQCFGDRGRRFVMVNNRIHKKSILVGVINALKKAIHIVANATVKKWGSPNNKSSWPERFPMSYWSKLFDEDEMPSRTRDREYYNNPREDGQIFKANWIQRKKMLDLSLYDALIVYGDLSYKEQGDFKALKLWGKVGREFHRIAVFCRQASRTDAAIWLYDLFEDLHLGSYNVSYYIEGLFSMDEFVNDFDIEGDNRGYYIPVVPDKRSKEGKFDRIEAISGFWERRNVWYNELTEGSSDEEEELEQLLAFEKGSGAHDDAPDADAGAFSFLNFEVFQSQAEVKIGKSKSKTVY